MADCIVDACCLINLYASGKLREILQALQYDCHVSEEIEAESLKVYALSSDDEPSLVLTPIDLSEAIDLGLMRRCRLEDSAEIVAFVQFATVLDDGEASCLAIAQLRRWSVATDDKKAIRVAASAGIAVHTTPEMLKNWMDNATPSESEVIDALRRIEQLAKFRPHRSNAFYTWWDQLVATE